MIKHTPGTLVCHGHDLYFAHKAGGFSLRHCPSPEANARRIAACWNLLAPFTTEQIEQGIDLVSLVRQRDEALQERQREHVLRVRLAGELETANQQRDELLEVLEDVTARLAWLNSDDCGHIMAATDRAKTIIAKAKAAQAGEGA